MDDQGSTQYKRSCLFNKFMRVSPLISTSVSRETILIECKVELQALKAEISRLRPTGAKLLSKAVEDLQVMLNVHSVKLWGDGYRSKRLALEDVLRVSVGKTSAGPINGVRTTFRLGTRCNLLDDGLFEPLLQDLTVLIHRESYRECQTLLPRHQTANLFAQCRR